MKNMTAVGIDVSKGKSTIAVIRPEEGEVVTAPYNVTHSVEDLHRLARSLKLLGGEVEWSWNTPARIVCLWQVSCVRLDFALIPL